MKKKSTFALPAPGGNRAVVQETAVADAHHVGAFAAKTHLSAILDHVIKGERFVITKHGKPIAELKPIVHEPKARGMGWMKGKIWIAPDFDAPLEDFKEYM